MSQQNVDVVRNLIAALNRRDIDAMLTKFYSQDAEFIPAMQGALEGTVYRLDRPWTFVFKLRDGKVVWQKNFLDHAEALEAVGLSE